MEVWLIGIDTPDYLKGYATEDLAKKEVMELCGLMSEKGVKLEWRNAPFPGERNVGRQYIYKNSPKQGYLMPFCNTGWLVQPMPVEEEK